MAAGNTWWSQQASLQARRAHGHVIVMTPCNSEAAGHLVAGSGDGEEGRGISREINEGGAGIGYRGVEVLVC